MFPTTANTAAAGGDDSSSGGGSSSSVLSLSSSSAPSTFSFSVSSWNVLADCYSRADRFTYCSADSLRWSSRLRLIKRELETADADIVCLQEVDHYEQLEPWLSALGYDSCYAQRGWRGLFPAALLSSGAAHLRHDAAHKRDGLCVAWKRSSFAPIRLLDPVTPLQAAFTVSVSSSCAVQPVVVQLNDLAFVAPVEQQLRYWRHNIALIVALQPLVAACDSSAPPCLLLACTHLYWSPLAEDVKYRQCQYLIARLQELQQLQPALCLQPVLLGDFNSTPASKVYALITRGCLSSEADSGDAAVSSSSPSLPRLLLEPGLFKLAKWLRSIGVDAAYCKDDMTDRDNIAVLSIAGAAAALAQCSAALHAADASGLPSVPAVPRAHQRFFAQAVAEKRIISQQRR